MHWVVANWRERPDLAQVLAPGDQVALSDAVVMEEKRLPDDCANTGYQAWLADQFGLSTTAPIDHYRACAELGLVDRPGGVAEPVHLQLGLDRMVLSDSLRLTPGESEQLYAVFSDVCDYHGWNHQPLSDGRFWLSHHSLAEVVAPSPQRCFGMDVADWLPTNARAWQALANEVQMAWAAHSLNEVWERERRLAANGLWLSGCGRLSKVPPSLQSRCNEGVLRGLIAAQNSTATDRPEVMVIEPDELRKVAHARRTQSEQRLTLCGLSSWCSLSWPGGWWPELKRRIRPNVDVLRHAWEASS